MPIPLALLALPAIAQAGTGIYQAIKGSKMKVPQSDAIVPAVYQERIN